MSMSQRASDRIGDEGALLYDLVVARVSTDRLLATERALREHLSASEELRQTRAHVPGVVGAPLVVARRGRVVLIDVDRHVGVHADRRASARLASPQDRQLVVDGEPGHLIGSLDLRDQAVNGAGRRPQLRRAGV